MGVVKKDVEYAAKLARLGLTEEEKTTFTEQLSNILDYANTINKLNTEGVEPTSHAIPMKNVFRDDRAIQCEDTDLILRNAPEEEKGMFKVPKILE